MTEFLFKLKYTYPHLYEYLKVWPLSIFVPLLLILIATLAFVTRAWDAKDHEQAQARARRANVGDAPNAAGSAGQ